MEFLLTLISLYVHSKMYSEIWKWNIVRCGADEEREKEEEMEKVVETFLSACVQALRAHFPTPSAFR